MKLIRHTVIVVLLTVFFSHNTSAKVGFQFGLTGGFSAANTSKEANVSRVAGKSLLGYNAGVKALLDYRWVQFGLGVETGSIYGHMERYALVSFGLHTPVFSMRNDKASLLGFYTNPYLLVNFKKNIGQTSYLYAGGVAGLMSGSSDISLGRYNSAVFGANLGWVMKLTDNIGIEVSEGWRRVGVYYDELKPEFEYYPQKGESNRSGAVVNYFSTNIGLRLSF